MNWIERMRETIALETEKRKRESTIIKWAGRIAEEKTAKALRWLQNRGEILNFFKTLRWSEEDRMGIDFIIVTPEGKKIFLQVKSRIDPYLVKKLKLKRINHNPPLWKKNEIWFIEVKEEESIKKIAVKIRRILELN